MAQKGTLIVEVYTSRAYMPVPEANVYITDEEDTALLAQRVSNESGRTAPVEIEAPDAELSLEPGPEGMAPFATVNVYVQKTGYFNMLFNGVQVFAGQESLQKVLLLPLPANYEGDPTEIITITPQEL